MLDFYEDAEERNLKLVNLVAACSYDDTAFDTPSRSVDRTEPKREDFGRINGFCSRLRHPRPNIGP